MPLIHTWQDIVELGGDDWLTAAEQKLIAACVAGAPCYLGDGKVPPEGTPAPDREIRADVLRYLITGGCKDKPVRDWGVRLVGGHITDELDLSFARAKGATGLIACRFDQDITALQTRFYFLNLNDSVLSSLNAQGTQITGTVSLESIIATGEVSLASAEIGGQLACKGAKFSATTGHALKAQDAKIGGGVFLESITATAEVSLSGAIISGQLVCTDATFTANKGHALNAQRLQVGHGLFWRDVKTPNGRIDFASAHIGDLADDVASWPDVGRLILNGFTYDRISGAYSTDANTRIKWLQKGSTWNGEFFPQPFTHLAKVLREMGHDGDARAVLYRREQLIRENIRARTVVIPKGNVNADAVLRNILLWDGVNAVRWVWDIVQRSVIGYGHHPFRSIGWLIALIALAGVLAHLAYDEGSFAPNSGPVLVSQDWKEFADLPGNSAALWSAKDAPGQDWETFYAVAWAADLVIPIVDLGQTDAWAPSTTRGPLGWHLWWLRWVFILFGWVVTALGAAALTGVIRRD